MLGWSDYVGSYYDQSAAGMACVSAAREVLAESTSSSTSGSTGSGTSGGSISSVGMPCWYLPLDMQASDSRFHFRLVPPSTKASPAGAYLFGSVFLIMTGVTLYCRCRFADPLEALAFDAVDLRRSLPAATQPASGASGASAPAPAGGRASVFARAASSNRGALLSSAPGPAALADGSGASSSGPMTAPAVRRRSLAPGASAASSAASLSATAAGGGFSGPLHHDDGIELVVSPLVTATTIRGRAGTGNVALRGSSVVPSTASSGPAAAARQSMQPQALGTL